MTYELAKQLNRDRNAQLWLAIVGMTSQYLQGHLDPAEYTTLAQQYSTLVTSKNSAVATISVPLTAGDDNAAAAAGQDAAGGAASLTLAASEDGRLTFDEDFRFKLHRHWSLCVHVLPSLAPARFTALSCSRTFHARSPPFPSFSDLCSQLVDQSIKTGTTQCFTPSTSPPASGCGRTTARIA